MNFIVEWAAAWQTDISIEKCIVMKIGLFAHNFECKINGIAQF